MKIYKVFLSIIGILYTYSFIINAEDLQQPKIRSIRDAHPIHLKECVDTMAIFNRPKNLSLSWILKEIIPMQRIGREEVDYDPYALKADSFINSSKIILNYTQKRISDTIFIREMIKPDQRYQMSIWQNANDIMYIFFGNGNVELNDQKYMCKIMPEYKYITSWEKKGYNIMAMVENMMVAIFRAQM